MPRSGLCTRCVERDTTSAEVMQERDGIEQEIGGSTQMRWASRRQAGARCGTIWATFRRMWASLRRMRVWYRARSAVR